MFVKDIVEEDFLNYKVPSMYICMSFCNWKCCVDAGLPASTCQNEPIAKMPDIETCPSEIYERYIGNHISSAIVFAGLEPFEQFDDIVETVKYFRKMGCNDDIVIYTGFNKEEIMEEVACLMEWPNIIIKYGRYVPNQEKHYDEVLGVELVSNNQYAERIS